MPTSRSRRWTLKKRAKEVNVDADKLEDAEEEDDVKAAIRDLIVSSVQERGAGGADSAADELATLASAAARRKLKKL